MCEYATDTKMMLQCYRRPAETSETPYRMTSNGQICRPLLRTKDRRGVRLPNVLWVQSGQIVPILPGLLRQRQIGVMKRSFFGLHR
jgi:hypothetical protein